MLILKKETENMQHKSFPQIKNACTPKSKKHCARKHTKRWMLNALE